MKIDKVILKNIGPHRDLTVDFKSGLIGILGANGAGKSTLVNSIYAALTNDFSRFGAAKADIISNTIGEKEKSYIKLVGEHRNQQFELTRSLRPNTNKLIYRKHKENGDWLESGAKTFTKASDVNLAIESELGISKLVIDKYVFVAQWEMFQFLSQTASERAKTFQYLCGTEVATEIQKACNTFVANTSKTQVIDNSLELEDQVKDFRASMDEYKSLGQGYQKKLLGSDDKKRFQRVLKDWALGRHSEAFVEATNTQRQALASTIRATRKELATLKKHKKEIEGQIDNHIATREDFSVYLEIVNESSLGTLFPYFVSCQDMAKEFEEAKQKVEECNQAIKAISVPDLSHPKAVKASFISEIENYSAILDMGRPGSSTTCPTCNQPVSENYFDSIEVKKESAEEGLKMMQLDIDNGEALARRVDTIADQRAAASRIVDRTEVTINHRNEDWSEGWQSIDQDTLHSFLLEYDRLVSELDGVDGDISVLQTQMDSDSREDEILKAKLESHSGSEISIPSDAELKEAQDALDAEEANLTEYHKCLGSWKEAKKSWKRAKKVLESLRERIDKESKIQNLTEVVKTTADVFHWNSLPKSVSQANLELLVHDINENLELFNNPFYVQADDDLTFKVFFPGKPPVKASQLSGGQKVVLAIAFRAALDRVFGRDVGMMFLDEPSSGLDADNVEYLHNALQQLATKVHGERQLVVITHVQELGGVFDQLIEINKG